MFNIKFVHPDFVIKNNHSMTFMDIKIFLRRSLLVRIDHTS